MQATSGGWGGIMRVRAVGFRGVKDSRHTWGSSLNSCCSLPVYGGRTQLNTAVGIRPQDALIWLKLWYGCENKHSGIALANPGRGPNEKKNKSCVARLTVVSVECALCVCVWRWWRRTR